MASGEHRLTKTFSSVETNKCVTFAIWRKAKPVMGQLPSCRVRVLLWRSLVMSPLVKTTLPSVKPAKKHSNWVETCDCNYKKGMEICLTNSHEVQVLMYTEAGHFGWFVAGNCRKDSGAEWIPTVSLVKVPDLHLENRRTLSLGGLTDCVLMPNVWVSQWKISQIKFIVPWYCYIICLGNATQNTT